MNTKPGDKPAEESVTQARTPIDWSAVHCTLAEASRITEATLNPSAERIASIFAQRARELACEKAVVKTHQLRELTLFELGAQQFAVDTRYLRGVAQAGAITRLPSMPQYLRGVASYKGDIVAVIDPGLLLNQQTVSGDSADYLLLVGEQRVEFALLVSSVTGQWTGAEDDIKPLDDSAGSDVPATTSLVVGLLTNPESTRAITVLDGAALLADERLYFTV